MSYQATLCAHLGRYRANVLGIAERGTFRHDGIEREYDHILPLAQRHANLIGIARDQVIRYLADHPGIKLHKFFHHLNSSQAFAFNLLFPYFEGSDADAEILLKALRQVGPLRAWEPEAVPDPEEQTNVDVLWRTDRGRTLCEVKLSETSFGKAVGDERHMRKLTDTYGPTLRGKVADDLLEPKRFFENYQLLRNLWHVVECDADQLLLLLPRANVIAWREAQNFLRNLGPGMRTRVSALAIEDVIEVLKRETPEGSDLRAHANELGRKYVP